MIIQFALESEVGEAKKEWAEKSQYAAENALKTATAPLGVA